MPELSIIMQTKLIREGASEKLIRAINSVLGQKQKCTFELIVVCDNCKESYETVINEFQSEFKGVNQRLKLFMLTDKPKNAKWRTIARNVGIAKAQGRWIMYIDNDDYYSNTYLKQICNTLDPSVDWYLTDDMIYNKQSGWRVRRVNLQMGSCGTANIIHKREMFSRWAEQTTYGRDDYHFISNLHKESKNYKIISIAGYCVCHLPGVNGYNI